jgi:hypothetical protein
VSIALRLEEKVATTSRAVALTRSNSLAAFESDRRLYYAMAEGTTIVYRTVSVGMIV